MKRIVFLSAIKMSTCFVLLLIFAVASVSNNAAAGDTRRPQPAQFLPGLGNGENLPCRYTGAFQQKRKLSGLDNSLGSRGKFFFDCELGLIWEIRDPVSSILVYTKRNLHYRLSSGAKVKPLDGKIQVRMAETLLNLLGGDTKALLEDFDIIDSPVTQSTVTHGDNSISLIPKRNLARQFVKEMRLTASSVSLQVFIDFGESGYTTIDIVNAREFDASCEDFGSLSDKTCVLLSTPPTTGQ